MTKRKAKGRPRKLKLKAIPEEGAYLIEIYATDRQTLKAQKFFPSFKEAYEFTDNLPRKTLYKTFRFQGWEQMSHSGPWYKD